ncbi:MAG: DNA mismatch repair endonuclease MutL [Candidatus Cloacimonetes bacterium]|nr:DNA mismatch repair endonuclease MutL [Candidatus Cloacimonadota bacterium]
MNRIKILAEEVANRIAAGEVVERPVSVVKELVENAIDSGAKKISVTVEKGGKKLIQVTDNGHGMSHDDALLSFERHATSKIRTVDDIFNISSLGFRGEALPSIASVSTLTMITRNADSDIATQIDFRGGQLINVTRTSANIGTTITVKNLFGNVPARKKFLKSEMVEYRHILNYLHYQSITYPEIHFTFNADGVRKLNYPAVNSFRERMTAVFGRDFFHRDLIEIDAKNDFASVSGYIGGLEDEQEIDLTDLHYLFINGRFIKDRIILHSIRAAYEPFLKKFRVFQAGKLPLYILFLHIEPGRVDFNVHPAKLEIRFTDPGWVHNFIKSTLTKALLKYEDLKYNKIKEKIKTQLQETPTPAIDKKIFSSRSEKIRFNDYKKEFTELYQPDLFRKNDQHDLDLLAKLAPAAKEIFHLPEEEIINPWQLHQSYIFVQVEDGLIIIDQHAAHERIIYEKVLHRLHGAPPLQQKLIFPLVVNLPPYFSSIVAALINDNIAEINKAGFNIKTFSNDAVVIDEIPAELKDWHGEEMFLDILKKLEEEYQETEDFRDSLAKSISCKAAIKAGMKMSKKEMLSLINDLFACEVPYYCPHGRPVIIKMTMSDFEKRFKRIG